LFFGHPLCLLIPFCRAVAGNNDFSAPPLDAGNLDGGSPLGHDDDSPDSETLGRKGDCLTVISAGISDDPARPLIGWYSGDGGVCPANLERSDGLELLTFKRDRRLDQGTQRR
jgi:hypothetical protein